MQPKQYLQCTDFPCTDVQPASYRAPDIWGKSQVTPEDISIFLISEAAPPNPADSYYASGQALFQQTTIQAFNDAGAEVTSIGELLEMGVYLTTAVKCGKTGYGIRTGTIETCSHLLEAELNMFPNVQVILLMGDVAIKALNSIARRSGEARVIPASATYKIHGGEFYFRGKRVFPSYLQAGPSFFIEKSKRRMIAEDLAAALRLVSKPGATRPQSTVA